MLAVPVLCAPQEMVLRLGMVKGIGYARSLSSSASSGAPSALLICSCRTIVGTTVAPWQLFFQPSYVIDRRTTPAFYAL